MYNRNSNKDWISTTVTATVGASSAATVAVILGREPLTALIILVFAVALALLIDRYF